MSNFIIQKITLSEEWPFRAREAEERAESRWAAFWMPPSVEPSPFKKVVYKATTLLWKDFTALIMVTASKTPPTSFHSAFRSSKNSPTKYGHHWFRTTTSNDHPTLQMSWRVSLRCSTVTLQPRRKGLLILIWHRIVAWPYFWTLVRPDLHLWWPLKTPQMTQLLSTNPQTFTW